MRGIEKFKLAALSPKVTDREVDELFLDLEISSGHEINEVVGILQKYRPNLFAKYESSFNKMFKI